MVAEDNIPSCKNIDLLSSFAIDLLVAGLPLIFVMNSGVCFNTFPVKMKNAWSDFKSINMRHQFVRPFLDHSSQSSNSFLSISSSVFVLFKNTDIMVNHIRLASQPINSTGPSTLPDQRPEHSHSHEPSLR